jgi:hypothetical protein
MKLWNTAFIWLLVSSVASAGITPVMIPDPKIHVDLDVTKALPNASQFKRPVVDPSPNGQYQLKVIGDRYASVFTAAGEPIAIFDLTMNHLGWKEIILGGIGFGNLNLAAFIKLFRKAKKAGKANSEELDENAVSLDQLEDDDAMHMPVAEEDRADALERGHQLFKGMRFTNRWAAEHGVPDNVDDGEGVPFRMESFTLADLQFPSADARQKAMRPFVMLAEVLYPDEIWTPEKIDDFAREIEFRYDEKLPGYQMVWNQKDKKKQPHLPGVLVNFVNPWQNLVYKHNLRQIKQYGETLIYYFGVYGMIVDFVVSRICQNLEERLDYHENHLVGLLEATERFEYVPGDFPMSLVDSTVDGLYLNQYHGTKDPFLMIGMGKRKRALAQQDKTRAKVLKILARKGERKAFTFEHIVGGKFAVARDGFGEGKGDFRGIYGLTTKPLWPLKLASYHVNPKTPAWKLIERYSWDLAGFAARVLIPNNLAFRVWKITVGIRLEPDMKDDFVRALMIHETSREGELAGLLHEAAQGRYRMPLSADEIALSLKRLRQTYVNPWRLSLDEEAEVIARNLKLIKERIGDTNPAEHFTGTKLVPVVP